MPEAPLKPVSKDECDFVAALLNDSMLMEKSRTKLSHCTGLGFGPLANVLNVMLQHDGPVTATDFEHEDARNLYAAAAATDLETIKDPAALVGLRLNRLEKESLRTEVANIMNQIQDAERSQDMKRMVELLQQKTQLAKQLEQVGAS